MNSICYVLEQTFCSPATNLIYIVFVMEFTKMLLIMDYHVTGAVRLNLLVRGRNKIEFHVTI